MQLRVRPYVAGLGVEDQDRERKEEVGTSANGFVGGRLIKIYTTYRPIGCGVPQRSHAAYVQATGVLYETPVRTKAKSLSRSGAPLLP